MFLPEGPTEGQRPITHATQGLNKMSHAGRIERKSNAKRPTPQRLRKPPGPKLEPMLQSLPLALSPSVDDTSDDGVDNREFAKQLSKAKEGKKFSNKAEGGKQKEKSVKQSRANQMHTAVVDEKPSDTGAEADDDRSPVESPVESPKESPEVRAVDASGVSDMLEPAAAGPSVLRITDTDKQKEKLKATKAPQKTETKKTAAKQKEG
ncbi:hypothetical protein J3459_004069 [Metarhizium acridum]|nr:hypothetical protein J3459_004069 [Metarhizium acridum]